MARKTVPGLATLDDPIVKQADHTHIPQDGDGRHRIHVSRTGGGWQWAHLVYMVSGWDVVASGSFPAADYATHLDLAQEITKRWRGERGDGFDELSHDAYLQRGDEAHIRREDDPSQGLCGTTGGPAVFSTREPHHAEQHCIDCDRRYRAAHYGRVAVTY